MNKYIGFCTIAVVYTLFAHFAYAQSTAFDASGAGGGSIIVGSDNRACTSTIVGAMRYNASENKIQICVVRATVYDWLDWGE